MNVNWKSLLSAHHVLTIALWDESYLDINQRISLFINFMQIKGFFIIYAEDACTNNNEPCLSWKGRFS